MIFTSKGGVKWYLHKKEVKITWHKGVTRTNYFFRKTKEEGYCELPIGYLIIETSTGMPLVKKL